MLTVRVLNIAFILALTIMATMMAISSLKRKNQESSHTQRFFLIIASGCWLWAIGYLIETIFQSETLLSALTLSKNSQQISEQLIHIVNYLVALSFMTGGSILLRLTQDRIHPDLPPPTSEGPLMKTATRIVGATQTLYLFAIGGLLLVLYALWNSQIEGKFFQIIEYRKMGDFVDSHLSWISMMTLALGIGRELNRHATNLIGLLTALSIFIYAFIPLLVLWFVVFGLFPSLEMPLYILASVFKWSIIIGLAGFSVLTKNISQAYRKAQEEYIKNTTLFLSQLKITRHEISNATNIIGFQIRGILWPKNHPPHKEFRAPLCQIFKSAWRIDKQMSRIRNLIETGLENNQKIKTAPVGKILDLIAQNLDGLYQTHVSVGKIENADIKLPIEPVREALHRIVENGAKPYIINGVQSQANYVTISAKIDEEDRSCLTLSVENDGVPIENPTLIFRRRTGGFWTARFLITGLGGEIKLIENGPLIKFKVFIPYEHKQ